MYYKKKMFTVEFLIIIYHIRVNKKINKKVKNYLLNYIILKIQMFNKYQCFIFKRTHLVKTRHNNVALRIINC